MQYYFDIKIVPDAEVPIYFIRNKIYTKLHKALFTLNAADIGVSFPAYKVKLGDVIRLHSSQSKLSVLQDMDWLGGLSSYCDVSSILTTPTDVVYRNISRKQSNMTEAKLRRLLKRGSITQEEVKAYKARMFQQGMDNPYLELESGSNGHKHRRYLQFSEPNSQPVEGEFDQFGLSKTATVPWF